MIVDGKAKVVWNHGLEQDSSTEWQAESCRKLPAGGPRQA